MDIKKKSSFQLWFPFCSSNKDLLVQHGFAYQNTTMEKYKDIVNNLNVTKMNFTLETCSLSEQLDNVIIR